MSHTLPHVKQLHRLKTPEDAFSSGSMTSASALDEVHA